MELVVLDCPLSHRKKVPAWFSWPWFVAACVSVGSDRSTSLWESHSPLFLSNYSECFPPSLSYLHRIKAVFSDVSRDEAQLATHHRQHRCDKKSREIIKKRRNIYSSSLSEEDIHVNIFPCPSERFQKRGFYYLEHNGCLNCFLLILAAAVLVAAVPL